MNHLAEMIEKAMKTAPPPRPKAMLPTRQYQVMIKDLWVAVTDQHTGEQRVWLARRLQA